MTTTNEVPGRDTTKRYTQAVKNIMSRAPKTQKAKTKQASKLETDQSARDRQYQKFVEKARELETDESEEAFDRVLKKVVKAQPPRDENKKQRG